MALKQNRVLPIIGALICAPGILLGCGTTGFIPTTLGEQASSYTYVPVDAISIRTETGGSCGNTDVLDLLKIKPDATNTLRFETLPEAFPDNTVRVAYKTVGGDGSVTFGPIKTAQKGDRYQIIIDFINSDVSNQTFAVSKRVNRNVSSTFEGPDTIPLRLNAKVPRGYDASTVHYDIRLIPADPQEFSTEFSLRTERRTKRITEGVSQTTKDRFKRLNLPDGLDPDDYDTVNIPVYIGVGLRVIADVFTLKGKTDIAGLGAIAAAVSNNEVSGSLVVQTLGINGKSITAAMPIQSDLNPTTVQNAIVSIGSIKALMYADETTLKPRVVGLYNPIGGGEEVVNQLISELSSERPIWNRPCVYIGNTPTTISTQ